MGIVEDAIFLSPHLLSLNRLVAVLKVKLSKLLSSFTLAEFL